VSLREHFKDKSIWDVIEAEDSLDVQKEGMSKLEMKPRAAYTSKGKIKLLV
jgi:hypothetical protein